ncbi:MAG: ABC transporter ATP-binding protein, partial [Burkholderiales bacterium]
MRITLERLTKRFGPLAVVSEVSFSIQEGELFTLLGPSGCGKTTLLRLVAGFYAADEGEIRFDDRVVNAVPPHERGIGMVFQNYALWPHMTVSENVSYGLKLRKVAVPEIAERVRAVLDKVKLGGLGDRYPGQLSGGQQQRVALARALVIRPDVLLLDEPLSNLDAKLRVAMRAEIKALHQRLKTTTVYVTHDQIEAMTMADRIVLLRDGRIEQAGAPLHLYERPATRYVAGFLGSPAMNFVAAHLSDSGALAVKLAGGVELALPAPRHHALTGRRGQPITLGVRPEHITRAGGDLRPGLVRHTALI